MPDLPEGAVRALSTWHLLNKTRDFPAVGAVIVAQAGLSPVEVGLLATIETTMQGIWKKQAPGPTAGAEAGDDER